MTKNKNKQFSEIKRRVLRRKLRALNGVQGEGRGSEGCEKLSLKLSFKE